MNNHDRKQIAGWVEKQLDDSLTSEEFNELQRMLTNQPEARELYLDLMHQNAHLQLERFPLSAACVGSADSVDELSADRVRPTRIAVWTAAVIGLAASLLLVVWWNLPTDESSRAIPVFAKIIDSSDAEWGDCTLPTAVGSDLVRGSLKIKRGLTTIRFASGAEVTLESPAELEIQSSLRGQLLAGTAVVEVPESAHGFRLSTPTAVAIDYGTAFSVSIDPSSRASSIEVLDGEVEVQHIGSGATRRLNELQRVVASTEGLSDSEALSFEWELSGASQSEHEFASLHRITTANGRGRDSSISRSQSDEVHRNSRNELVLIKNPFEGYEQFSRKGYFAFDLGSLNSESITTAKFVLTLRPSGLGFASKVGDCEFVVYGMTDESRDNWSAQKLDWQTAPANLDGAAEVDESHARELGRFVIRRGRQYGQVSLEGDELVKFLNADTNEIVTMIVARLTMENAPGGLVHGFANHSNSFAAPPTLFLNTQGKSNE